MRRLSDGAAGRRGGEAARRRGGEAGRKKAERRRGSQGTLSARTFERISVRATRVGSSLGGSVFASSITLLLFFSLSALSVLSSPLSVLPVEREGEGGDGEVEGEVLWLCVCGVKSAVHNAADC